MDNTINMLLVELCAKGGAYGRDYKGYKVVIPEYEYDEEACVGLPLVILVKGDEARISTPEEALEYHAMCFPDEEE